MQWYVQRSLSQCAANLRRLMLYEQIMLQCTYLKISFFYLYSKLLFAEYLAVCNTASPVLIWIDALVWKELCPSLLLYLALLITHVTCCLQQNHRTEASFRYFSCPLCWHLLFSSSHSKIVGVLYRYTFSADTQEFCTKIAFLYCQWTDTH